MDGWLIALRCAITASNVGDVGVGWGGLVRNFLHGAGIGFGIDGLEMVVFCCTDGDGP